MQVVFYIVMFILGSCLGSFLCCQARRWRLKETKQPSLGSRSVCPHCGHKLKWYENIPLISWLIQKGSCRACHQKIGTAEFLSELGLGLAFLAIAVAFVNALAQHSPDPAAAFGLVVQPNTASAYFISASPFNWGIFVTTLLLTLNLGFLAIYDGLYGELPSLCLTISAICAIIVVILKLWSFFSVYQFTLQPIWDIFIAIAVFGGIYLALFAVSKGKWVGDGDWILAGIIAAALGTPWLALIALFIANFTACLISLPIIKKQKDHKIFFGPFLTAAYVLTLLISTYGIINLW